MFRHREETSRAHEIAEPCYPQLILRLAFYAFIFSLPYETLNIGITIKNFTVSKLVGFVFIGLTILQPRLCFKRPSLAFFYFSLYIYICVLFALLQESAFDGLVITNIFTLAQLMVLFWVSQNLMAHSGVAKGALLALSVSAISLAVMVLLGIMSSEAAGGRISALGTNPNSYSAVLSLGLLALVGLTNSRKIVSKKIRWLTWVSFGILALPIVQSGSRGVMVALVLGLLVLVMKDSGLRLDPRATLLVCLVIGTVIVAVYQFEPVRVRWERALSEGDVAGRDKIMERSVEMFQERPLMGWGPVAHYYELGKRSGTVTMGPHSLYFWLVHEVGLLGAIPFSIGLWLCGLAAWKARVGDHGQLPIAMLFFFLLLNMNGTYIHVKLFWIVLAYTLASERRVNFSKETRQISRKRTSATT